MNYGKKKLLIFQHDSSLYGASLSLMTFLDYEALHRLFEVLVLLPYPGEMEHSLRNKNIGYKTLSYPHCVSNNSKCYLRKGFKIIEFFYREYRSKRELEKVILDFKPDIIYSNTSIISIGYRLSKVINVPHVWHVREYSDFYNFQYLPSKFIVRKYISKSELTLYSSKALMDHWNQKQHPHSKVIYNGILNDISNPKLRISQNNVWKFGLLGLVVRGKGHDIAIQAFSNLVKKHHKCELHFWGGVGDQLFKNYLMTIVEEKNCKSFVFFHDFEANNKLIYNQLDVVLNCSTNEAFGRTIIEAMSLGIPVIANSSGGPLEIIDDSINGLFYNQTPESLLEKMEQLIVNKELFHTISKNAFEKAHKNFLVKRYQEDILNSLCDLLNLRSKT